MKQKAFGENLNKQNGLPEDFDKNINMLGSMFFSLASSVIVILDDSGKIKYLNKIACQILGYPKEDLIGKDWFRNCIPPENYESTREVFNKIMNGKLDGVAVFENPIINNDGQKILIRWHNTYLKNSQGQISGAISFGDNIGAELIMKQELVANEEKFRTVAEQSTNIIFINQNGHIVYANNAAARITGYSLKDLYSPKFDFRKLIAKNFLPIVNKAFLQHRKDDKLQSYECEIIAKDSSKIPVIIDTQVIKYQGSTAILGTITDVAKLKKTEAALRESESILKSILNSLEDLVFVINEKGIFTYFACRNESLLYAKPEFFMNKHYSQVMPPEIVLKMKKALTVCKQGKSDQYEYVLKIGNSMKYFNARMSPLVDRKEYGGVVAIIRDITKEKEIERILEESEQKNRLLVQMSPNVILIHQDNKIVFINSAGLRLAKIPKVEDILGKDIFTFIHPSDRDLIVQRIKQLVVLRKKTPMTETRLIDSHGNLIYTELYSAPIDYDGKVAVMTVIHDITDRKKVELELAETAQKLEKAYKESILEKNKFKSLLANIGDGIIATDKAIKIALVNNAAKQMLGITEKEVIGRKTDEIIKIVDEAGVPLPIEERPYTKAFVTGKSVKLAGNKSYYYVRKDGTRFPVIITATPFLYESDIIGSIISFNDITKEKEFEQVKSDFVSLASHQLRTPIGIMSWYLEMLLSGDLGPINDQQKEYLQETWRNSRRLAELVNALLNISRIEAGVVRINPQIINLTAICKEMANEMINIFKEKNIVLTQEYVSGLEKYNADEIIFKIIVQNLLSNAYKYTPSGGKIKIKTVKEKSRIVISVQDNGHGIPIEEQGKIFSRLYRASNIQKSDTDGTGLGLYIVKSLTESANGKIWFDSSQDKGSTFYISLPLTGMSSKKGSKGLEFSNYKE